ncbi:MAG: DUF86 domain-containing protein [Deltaproteobacteria bacterium]|nr:DUF86 domain-containing protein [Deltaproteobacteria bacterium]
MRRDDEVRLRHMLDAAREAISFTQGRTRSNIESDRLLALALTKSIEIIGEAASRLSAECREAYPQVPWVDIIGMRNRLIHAYFDIDSDRVWDTVADDLPQLVAFLEGILKSG